MSYSTIDKPTDYFNTVTYTGSAGGQTISGVGNQPDFIWVKQRADAGYDHSLHNSVSGVLKQLISNSTAAEITNTDTVTSTNADGFVLGADTAGPNANANNQDTKTYVAWNWKAGGSASNNTDGSITSSVSVDTTAGFSIVSYTGTGSNATVGHGLGVAPNLIITKQKSGTTQWNVQNSILGYSKYMSLNTNELSQATGGALISSVSSTTYSCDGNSAINAGSSSTYVSFCFAEKQGYSKFGSYAGNGNADGTFVYTGFKPAFIIIKAYSHNNNWKMFDNRRDPVNNGTGDPLNANSNDAEDDNTAYDVDFLSNGFKNRNTNANLNHGSYSYFYMAFAENPLVGSNFVPTTAR
tara:strand:- start:154 stop:1212 length:1059 start_codon:yes stop_codon:yes gene_type:complete